MHHEDGQGTQQLNGEIPVGNAINTVHAHAVKAKLLRFKHPVGMVGCAGQRTAADGRHVHAPTAIGKPSQVPQQHHGVGHQVVAEGDGLGALQVGVARHDGIGIGFRLVGDHLSKLADKLRYLVDFIPEIHTEIQRHLVIAAAGGVELLAHIADPAGEHLLHEHMDVLARHVKGKCPRGKVIENFFQFSDNLLGLLLGDNALRPQHGCVRHTAGDVLAEHPAVKMDGGIKIIRQLTGFAAGTPSPQFCHVPLLLFVTSYRPPLPEP